MQPDPTFWRNRRVFLTGHTGFKGGWLALWLARMGAEVCGYALSPASEPNLFTAAGVGKAGKDLRGDIRDASTLEPAMREFAPEVVFHLAAQPLVRASYGDPIGTYETNVIGTARVLEAVRRTPSVRAVVSVTTDKCYENREWLWSYRETDPLGGYDPYSSSKACAEIVSAAYRQSFFPPQRFAEHRCALATARAGNVIGGGDWSADRLLPDLIRGFVAGEFVLIRHPEAVRPWQHVLEPLAGYMTLAEHLCSDRAAEFATAFNLGPSNEDARPVRWVVERMAELWGDGARWRSGDRDSSLHEAQSLRLNASRAQAMLQWRPRLNLESALEWTAEWYRAAQNGDDLHALTLDQIGRYEALGS